MSLWADLSVLQQQWSSFLPLVDSLPCWVSASTLLLVLQRTYHLRLLPPTSLGSITAAAVGSLGERVCALLPDLVPQVLPLAETTALSYTHQSY